MRRTWDRTRLIRECYLFFILATIAIALLSLQYFQARYLFATLPFLILWAAKGIDELEGWVAATREAVFRGSRFAAESTRLFTCSLVMGGLFVLAFQQNASLDDFGGSRESIANAKQAGLWLREQRPAEKSVMDAGSAIPYYSKSEYLYLPHSSSSTALRYIKEKRPDYIVLRGTMRELRPYVSEWMQAGIPDRNAVLVYSAGDSLSDMVQIYKWEDGKEGITGGADGGPQGNIGNANSDLHKGTASHSDTSRLRIGESLRREVQ